MIQSIFPKKNYFIFFLILISLCAESVYAACNVKFEWTPNPETYVQGYKIYYGPTKGGPYTEVFDAGKPEVENDKMTATIQALPSGTWYFVATAYYNENESEYSTEINFVCQEEDPTILPPPSNLNALPGNSIDLSWSSVSGADGYNVYRSTVSGSGYSRINGQTPVISTSYVDHNTTPGTTYYYVVTSVDSAGGESVYSSEVSATEPLGNQAPSISTFSAAPNPAKNPHRSIDFSVQASDPDGDVLSYIIDFGDGSSSSSSSSAAHAYSAKGTYTAKTTVSDGQGHSVEKTIQVTVNDNKPTKVTGVQAQ